MRARSSPVTPDTASYTTAMTAWSRSGDPDSADRMWKLYTDMVNEKIRANLHTYTLLIQFLSKTRTHENLDKAESLRHCMEREQLGPDNRHFLPIVEQWLATGETGEVHCVLRLWIDAFSTGTSEVAPSGALCHKVMQSWLVVGNPSKARGILESFQVLHQT